MVNNFLFICKRHCEKTNIAILNRFGVSSLATGQLVFALPSSFGTSYRVLECQSVRVSECVLLYLCNINTTAVGLLRIVSVLE
jgi:hypothetical protein